MANVDPGNLMKSVTQFQENEQRVQKFVNEKGYYETNTEPAKEVMTLPTLMDILIGRYKTLNFKGDWQPETDYSQNDIVKSPGVREWWIVTEPYTSSDDFNVDVENKNIVVYGQNLNIDDTNDRALWVADRDYAEGDTITLPAPYYPRRNTLVLMFNGFICIPKHVDSSEKLYNYEEVGDDKDIQSVEIILGFSLKKGDFIDEFVISSALTRHYERIMQLAEEIASIRAECQENTETTVTKAAEAAASAEAAADSEEVATTKADEASDSATSAASSSATAQTAATTATLQAGIATSAATSATASETTATAKAGEAATSAASALNSLQQAASAASAAAASETTATTKAGEAADSAEEALDALAEIQATIGDVIDSSIDANDKVLSSNNGKLKANLSFTHDPATGILQLLGLNDEVIDEVDLGIDQFVESVDLVTNPQGQPAGTYLKIVFITTSGESPQFVEIGKIAKEYISGNAAIDISTDHKVSLKVDANSNLAITANGLSIKAGFKLMTDAQSTKLDGLPSVVAAQDIKAGRIPTTSDIPAMTSITLPESFVVGKNQLFLVYENCICEIGQDAQYLENGSTGQPSNSFELQFTVKKDSIFTYRIFK
jgi:hypothetical protein